MTNELSHEAAQPTSSGLPPPAPRPAIDAATLALVRIIAVSRLVLAIALGMALLLGLPRGSILFPLVALTLGIYFVYAVATVVLHSQLVSRRWMLLVGDAAVLVVVLLFAPTLPAAFLLFFVYFALVVGFWQGWKAAGLLSLLVSAAYLALSWREARAAIEGTVAGEIRPMSWAVAAGLLTSGVLVGTLAQRERGNIERVALLEYFSSLLSLDAGWPHLWRDWLAELCRRFQARQALLTFREASDHVLLLQLRSNPHASLQFEESERPPLDQRTFWLDGEPLSLLATGGVVSAGGFALQQAVPVHVSLPAVPERLRAEFSPRALLSVPFAVGGEWRGRLFLLDTESGSFSREQLADLQQLLVGLTPVLSNLLAVRTLMTQALDNERDRVVRELHDSVAQTLASIEMQLAVYRRLATQDPARTSAELERLQRTVKQEKEEFRRFLRALKPVRVSPQELVQWILAHSAQFQQETGIQVEVVAGPVDSRLPEGVCREVFLIFREALHNVQKHARAREVRVQLRQDENYLRLLVDDDGCGFPFSGTYSQNALEETGNAPLSICERTRSLGGMLSIDSAPGSGATLRVDIPLR